MLLGFAIFLVCFAGFLHASMGRNVHDIPVECDDQHGRSLRSLLNSFHAGVEGWVHQSRSEGKRVESRKNKLVQLDD